MPITNITPYRPNLLAPAANLPSEEVDGPVTSSARTRVVANQVGNMEVGIKVALKSGTFTVPGPFQDPVIKIRRATSAEIHFHVEKVGSKAMITQAELRFVDPAGKKSPIQLKNPTGASAYSKPGFATLLTKLKDGLSDATIQRIFIKGDGQVELEGKVLALGKLFKWPLMNEFKDDELPQMNLEFAKVANGNTLVKAGVTPPNAKPVDLTALTASLGKVVGEIAYDVDLETHGLKFAINDENQPSMVGFNHFEFASSGTANLTFDSSYGARVANLNDTMKLHLSQPFAATRGQKTETLATSDLAITASTNLTSENRSSALSGHSTVKIHAKDLKMQSGTLSINIHEPVNMALKVSPLKIAPANNTFALKAEGKLPSVLLPPADRLEVSMTENGGTLTVSGATEDDHLFYRRELPAFV